MAITMTALTGTVLAADPLSTINSLSDFIFSAIKANGFLTFFGGVIIAFAKDILDMIM